MTKTELNQYRRQLEEMLWHLGDERTELRHEVFQADGPATASLGDQYAEDDVSRWEEQEEVAIALLTVEDDQLTECRRALDRIRRGTFGKCEHCRKPMSKDRLKALPYARLCIRCARAAENMGTP
jgi:DnaK suppressor protein